MTKSDKQRGSYTQREKRKLNATLLRSLTTKNIQLRSQKLKLKFGDNGDGIWEHAAALEIQVSEITTLLGKIAKAADSEAMVSDVALDVLQGARPILETGKKIKESAKKGHTTVHGTPEQKAERYARYQTELNRLHREEPSRSLAKNCELAGRTFKVNPKTIARHTTKPQ